MTTTPFVALLEHTLRDTLPMLPVLFVLYTALELLSHRQGPRLLMRRTLPRAFGPLAGALLGIIPQCGMSVFMTSLFLGGRVTTGTLLATYLATSDEAIPVLLAHGNQFAVVAQIIGIKIAAGVISGGIVDALSPRLAFLNVAPHPATVQSAVQRRVETEMHEAPWTRALVHSLRRTLEIFAWVFVITVAIGILIPAIGLDRIGAAGRAFPAAEIVVAAVFGLVPNCSASIAIAEAYLRGVLSFGATVAGLCAGAGYGPILLLRRGIAGTAMRLLVITLFFSIVAGAIVAAMSGGGAGR